MYNDTNRELEFQISKTMDYGSDQWYKLAAGGKEEWQRTYGANITIKAREVNGGVIDSTNYNTSGKNHYHFNGSNFERY